jgi:hypothetical protein
MKLVARLFVAALLGGLLVFGIEKYLAIARRNQVGSLTGQTLTDLSRALEIEKERTGAYPDSITRLPVSGGGDFSEAILRRVVYRKTTNGYIAFVGAPHVVYIEPDKSAHFE